MISYGKVNTCDLVYMRRPYACISPQWCIMCKEEAEIANPLFLLCPIALVFWKWMFGECNLRWDIPVDCVKGSGFSSLFLFFLSEK